MGKPRIAVTFGLPKTSALLFEQVACIANPDKVPASIAYTPTSASERQIVENLLAPYEFVFSINTETAEEDVTVRATDSDVYELVYSGRDAQKAAHASVRPLVRDTVRALQSKLQLEAFPVYDSPDELMREYAPGGTEVIVAVFEQLGLVEESTLEWEQVLQFRKDHTAQAQYRKLCHWFDSSMVGKSIDFIRDDISLRMDSAAAALRKHGLRSAFGTLSVVLDPKVFAAAGAGYAALMTQGLPAAPWLAGGIVVGNAAVRIAKEMLDLKDARATAKGEIAFVHHLRKELQTR